MAFVETDLRAYLLLRGTTTATNTFIGPIRKARAGAGGLPVQAVFLHTSGGLNPQEYMSSTPGVDTYRRADVKVRIRSAVNDYADGSALAESVWRSLQAPSTASLSTGSTAYCRVTCFESAPVYLGINDLEQDEWQITVRAEFQKQDLAVVLSEDGNSLALENGDLLEMES
jgi:hypothetical protein